MKEWTGKVYQNRDAGGAYKVITLSMHKNFEEPIAGQFVMFDCGFMEDGIILRRPMAFYDFVKRSEDVLVSILYHVVGKGTERMSKMKVGDTASFLGPIGNAFSVPKADEKIWVVGGGIGIAPFLLWLKQIKHRENVRIFFGFREDAQLQICEDFSDYSKFLTTCVQNGSKGDFQGTVVVALEQEMRKVFPDRILTCGPTIMMEKTIEVGQKNSIPLEVSLEAKMGCGIGVCLSCVTPIQHQKQKGSFSLVCKDGPIFTV